MDSQIKSSLADESMAALKDIPTKEALLTMLYNDVYQVTFNKLNGDQRVMTCTLSPHFLPEYKWEDEEATEQGAKETNPVESKNVTVWDLNAAAWRSFHYVRVTKVRVANSGSSAAMSMQTP